MYIDRYIYIYLSVYGTCRPCHCLMAPIRPASPRWPQPPATAPSLPHGACVGSPLTSGAMAAIG